MLFNVETAKCNNNRLKEEIEMQAVRPVTQANSFVNSSKSTSSEPYNKLGSLATQGSFQYDENLTTTDKRPVTINSTKSNYRRKMHQPTYYGGFKAPGKAKFLTEMAIRNGKCVKVNLEPSSQNVHPNPYGLLTAERFFPSTTTKTPGAQGSLQKKCIVGDNKLVNIKNFKFGLCYEGLQTHSSNMWKKQQAQRRITISECGTILRQQKRPLPFLTGKVNEVNGNMRPYTGVANEKVIEASSTPRNEEINRARLETAQAPRRNLIGSVQSKPARLSTPQTIPEKRPDSRYNSASLYAKLEHGRGNSPEYQVPILEMRFSDLGDNPLIPTCWK